MLILGLKGLGYLLEEFHTTTHFDFGDHFLHSHNL